VNDWIVLLIVLGIFYGTVFVLFLIYLHTARQ